MKTALINGKVVTPEGVKETNILMGNGVIAGLTNEKINADKVIDCKNKIIVPGLIDMHVHLREPGLEYKETIESGSMAAVAGGVTSICCMANTSPVNDNSALTYWIYNRAKEIGLADVFPYACVSKGMQGEELTEMGDILEAGAAGFSDDGRPVTNSEVMRRALEYSRYFGSFISCHEEDVYLFNKGVIHEGKVSTIAGLRGIPYMAEAAMVARDIMLAKFTKGRVHICHVSSKETIKLIKQAKEDGVNITAEATANHTFFNDEACLTYDVNTKMNPPFRAEEDRLAIIDALKSGVLDCTASDHAPHHLDDKFMEFDLASYGVLGLQFTVPVFCRHIEAGLFNWNDFVRFSSYSPAKILGKTDRGAISKGLIADIAVIDPNKEYIFDETVNRSKCTNTAFWGKKMKGKVDYTFKNGRLVYQG